MSPAATFYLLLHALDSRVHQTSALSVVKIKMMLLRLQSLWINRLYRQWLLIAVPGKLNRDRTKKSYRFLRTLWNPALENIKIWWQGQTHQQQSWRTKTLLKRRSYQEWTNCSKTRIWRRPCSLWPTKRSPQCFLFLTLEYRKTILEGHGPVDVPEVTGYSTTELINPMLHEGVSHGMAELLRRIKPSVSLGRSDGLTAPHCAKSSLRAGWSDMARCST